MSNGFLKCLTLGLSSFWLAGCDDVARVNSSAETVTVSVQFKGVALASAEFGHKSLPGVYGGDYIYPNQTEVDYFKAKKMTVIRLPFLWERLQPSLNQAFDQTEFNRLNAFVTATTAKNMSVILDPHNYARYRDKLIGSGDVPVTAFSDLWQRLATEYKNNSRVIFAVMNEPHTMPTEQWLTAANAVAHTIRATGATNLMLIPGNSWTGAHSWSEDWYGTPNAQVMLNFVDPGNNYAIEVHQYFDADHSGTQPACTTTKGSDKLSGFNDWLIANKKRGFLGEFAGANNVMCRQAVEDALKFLENNKDHWVGWTWWAAGPWWADYMYTLEPKNGTDAAQMAWLKQFL